MCRPPLLCLSYDTAHCLLSVPPRPARTVRPPEGRDEGRMARSGVALLWVGFWCPPLSFCCCGGCGGCCVAVGVPLWPWLGGAWVPPVGGCHRGTAESIRGLNTVVKNQTEMPVRFDAGAAPAHFGKVWLYGSKKWHFARRLSARVGCDGTANSPPRGVYHNPAPLFP